MIDNDRLLDCNSVSVADELNGREACSVAAIWGGLMGQITRPFRRFLHRQPIEKKR